MTLIDIVKRKVKHYDEQIALTQLATVPDQRILLEYVIKKHSGPILYYGQYYEHGILPRRKTTMHELGFGEGNSAQGKLRKSGFLTTVKLSEILFSFCTFNGRWNVPSSLEPTIREDIYNREGRRGGMPSWNDMIKSTGTNIPTYYVALITREGVPVYKGILPNLPL